LVAVEPVHGLHHRHGAQAASNRPPGLAAGDQAGIGQDVEMLHDGRQRDWERPRQLADRHFVRLTQMRQKGPPGWVGKRCENTI
jgi:hypothetical protein